MEDLTKVETAAALAAVSAVLDSGTPYLLGNEHPLKTAKKKFENNLEEFNTQET